MRLLLLLSAFLTAMVGVGAPAAAAPRAVCEVSASASAHSERLTPRIALVAKHAAIADERVATGVQVLTSAPARSVPIYAGRLRV